jgi:hypothetical protein
MRSTFRVLAVGAIVSYAALGAACESTPTSPGPGNTLPVVEQFIGTLQPSGEAFYAFSMSKAGSVSLTLVSMTGPSVPDDALFPVGIGQPIGTGCTASTDAAVKPGPSPQFTTDKNAGVYCIRLADNARLGAAATFFLNIVHPR